MAGVTDLPFRLLCARYGSALQCMEMVSAKAIMYNNKNTEALLEIHPDEMPVSLQLFGSDPEIMAAQADMLCEDGNSRNGYRERKLSTSVGEITMKVPSCAWAVTSQMT